MPIVNYLNAFLGAAVLGVVGAAGVFLVEHYKQNKVRHEMAKDLARLDQELSQMRRELDQLLHKKRERLRKSKGNSSSNEAISVTSVSTIDGYSSVSDVDSSDLEFYDVTDDELDLGPMDLENALNIIDVKLDSGTMQDLEDCLLKLGDLCIEHPGNPELLWRIGKAHQKISDKSNDLSIIEEHISKGIEACSAALTLKDDSAEIHKWYAILVGSRSNFVSQHEKICDAYLFKKHVDAALALHPSDPSLHHLLGRFNFEVAALKWYERKAAAALFGEPPKSSVSEALVHFMEAERLVNFDWKKNKLMIAKCKIACGKYKEAVEWLQEASNCTRGNRKVDTEVKELLKKYKRYR